MKIINATPHDIVVISRDNVVQDPKTKQFTAVAVEIKSIAKYEKSGILPRVSMTDELIKVTLEGAPIHAVKYGEIDGLPDEQPGIYYIVSGLVASAGVKLGRKDLVAPGGLVRDVENSSTVLGCLFLQLQ